MNESLSNADQVAVGFVLDQLARMTQPKELTPSEKTNTVLRGELGASSEPISAARVRRVEGLLRQLEVIPAGEPEGDLVDRTLRRIKSGNPRNPAAGTSVPVEHRDPPVH